MRTMRFLLHHQSRNDHGVVRREALRNPVLLGPLGGAIDAEHLVAIIPSCGGFNDKATVDTRQALSEAKATEIPVLLHLVQERNLRWVAKGQDRPCEQVDLHGEPDAEAWADLRGVLGQQTVRLEELFGLVPQVRELQGSFLDELPQAARALRVVDA